MGLGGAKETRVMPYEELSSIVGLDGNSKCCVSGDMLYVRLLIFLLRLAFFFVGDMVRLFMRDEAVGVIRLKDD